jgi:hypothetical protein
VPLETRKEEQAASSILHWTADMAKEHFFSFLQFYYFEGHLALHCVFCALNVFLPFQVSNAAWTTSSSLPFSHIGGFFFIRELLSIIATHYAIRPLFSSQNRGEKHCIRIPVGFRLYLVKIIQILTN